MENVAPSLGIELLGVISLYSISIHAISGLVSAFDGCLCSLPLLEPQVQRVFRLLVFDPFIYVCTTSLTFSTLIRALFSMVVLGLLAPFSVPCCPSHSSQLFQDLFSPFKLIPALKVVRASPQPVGS